MPTVKFEGFKSDGHEARRWADSFAPNTVAGVAALNAHAPSWAFRSTFGSTEPTRPEAVATALQHGPLEVLEDWAFVWASFVLDGGRQEKRTLELPLPAVVALRRTDSDRVAIPVPRYANAATLPVDRFLMVWAGCEEQLITRYGDADAVSVINTAIRAVAPTGEECDAVERSLEILANRAQRLVVRARIGGVCIRCVHRWNKFNGIASEPRTTKARVVGIFDDLEYPAWVTA